MRPNITYTYESSQSDEDLSWSDEDEPLHDPASLIQVPAPRALDWDRILQHVPVARHAETRQAILQEFLDAFIDGDHKVEYDGNVLRFKASHIYSLLNTMVDLNVLCVKVHVGDVPKDQQRQLLRKRGYSLDGYLSLRDIGLHGHWQRTVKSGRVKESETPIWLIQETFRHLQ